MAERRMFTKTIIDSDAFLDMPLSTQSLYFHLAMRADDDGFLNNPLKIMRVIGCNKNDYDLLVAKNFIITFENGVIVIKHWKMHNYIQKDRYKSTVYIDEKSMLSTKENGSYTLLDTQCIQDVSTLLPQVRLGKVSLELDKENIEEIYDFYLSLGLIKHRTFTADMKKAIESAMKNNKYSIEYCKDLIQRHNTVVELTKCNKDYKVIARSLSEFFGQKVANAKHLICSEYDEGGKYYEKYIRKKESSHTEEKIMRRDDY